MAFLFFFLKPEQWPFTATVAGSKALFLASLAMPKKEKIEIGRSNSNTYVRLKKVPVVALNQSEIEFELFRVPA